LFFFFCFFLLPLFFSRTVQKKSLLGLFMLLGGTSLFLERAAAYICVTVLLGGFLCDFDYISCEFVLPSPRSSFCMK